MKLLVLGGTRFVGRAIVEEALARGHSVTVVHRGQTGDAIFGDRVETIHADRLVSLDALKGRTWDACIDTCGYIPRAIRIAGDALKGNVGHYAFISTISVYANRWQTGKPVATEEAPLMEEGDPENEEINGESYGYLKVLCEREVVRQFGDGSFLPRPGIVIGPNDHTDRFTYWVHRIATEPRVLVPSEKGHFAQWIDARDLAAFTVGGVERKLGGAFSVVGQPMPLHELLEEIRRVLNTKCEFVEADLASVGVEPWADLPLVIEAGDTAFQLNPGKALAAGLTPRPVEATVRDLWEWFQTQGREPIAGMSRDLHDDVLAKAAIQ